MQDLKVTIIQSDVAWANIKANLNHFTDLIGTIEGDTDLIVLPEMFSTGFAVEDESCAEPTKGKAFEWMKKMSRETNTVIVGSVFVKEGSEFYNRLIWMQPDGNYSYYDKRHLFRLAGEQKKFTQGKSRVICELKGWKILPLVCYDLRFPVWSKNRYLENRYEYDCLFYLANWPGRRSFAWNSLLVARAIENQAYVIGVNRIGLDDNSIPHQGDSAVYNYRGRVEHKCFENQQEVKTVLLKKEELIKFREGFTVGLDWDNFEILV